MKKARVVCTSDTHSKHGKIEIPNGDILIHAGDFTYFGRKGHTEAFDEYLGTLPHTYKVVIPGNHEGVLFQYESYSFRNAIFLQDSETEVMGIRIYGSSWQPQFRGTGYFMHGEEIAQKWSLIPEGIDILVTHTPPFGYFDGPREEHWGCMKLRRRIDEMTRKPKLCVFGHIHEAYGMIHVDDVTYVNASMAGNGYEMLKSPIVVDLEI